MLSRTQFKLPFKSRNWIHFNTLVPQDCWPQGRCAPLQTAPQTPQPCAPWVSSGMYLNAHTSTSVYVSNFLFVSSLTFSSLRLEFTLVLLLCHI